MSVHWVGAQRDVLAGDLTGKIALEALRDIAHLYALGPVEGLRGEVSIFDGRPSVSRVANGAIAIDESLRHRACFLVYASVAEWTTVPLTDAVFRDENLEATVVEAAKHHGVDVTLPFPFLIDGRADRLTLHILDKRDGLPHTPALHERAKVRFSFAGEPVEVVGFFSDRHRGIFTPKDENLHMHVRTRDGRASGHVDDVELAAGSLLRLPRKGDTS